MANIINYLEHQAMSFKFDSLDNEESFNNFVVANQSWTSEAYVFVMYML